MFARTGSLRAEWLIFHRFDLGEQPERVTDYLREQLQTGEHLPILRPFRLELDTLP